MLNNAEQNNFIFKQIYDFFYFLQTERDQNIYQKIITDAKKYINDNKTILIHKDNTERLAYLLGNAINVGSTEIVELLIEMDAKLIFKENSALHYAVIMGRKEIYEKIEQKIIQNPKKYRSLYMDLKKGRYFHRFLIEAIHQGDIDFALMLLHRYQKFYLQHDFKEFSIVNILFEYGSNNIDSEGFNKIYETMLSLGYKDIHFDVSNQKLDAMLQSMITWNDIDHIQVLLLAQKDVQLVDANFQSPQERIQGDNQKIASVALALLNHEFNDDDSKIASLHEKLRDLILLAKASKGTENHLKIIEEFNTLLHTGNHFFMTKNYPSNSADLLEMCIRYDLKEIAEILIAADADLIFKNRSLLDIAAESGNISIYTAIEMKILSTPEKYPVLFDDLIDGNALPKYLTYGIIAQNTEFVQFLLEKYHDFFVENNQKEYSPINILFKIGRFLPKTYFDTLYTSMLSEGFNDVDLDMSDEQMQQDIILLMIAHKNMGYIKQYLQAGNDIPFIDTEWITPQQHLQAGRSLNHIINRLLSGKFSLYHDHQKKAYQGKITENNLSPEDSTYTHILLSTLPQHRMNVLKNNLSSLLSSIELGKTTLPAEIEKQLYAKLSHFLNKPAPLFLKNINRVDATLQLLKIFRNPESLDQEQSNLCGVATFIQMLIDNHPLEMIDNFIAFCENGKTENLYFVESAEKFKENGNIFQAFIKSYKNKHSFYGYDEFNNKLIEAMLSGTKSKSIAGWMEALGYENIEDTWEVVDEKGKEIPMVYRGILGGLYSTQYHQHFENNQDRLNALLDAYHQKKSIILCIGPLLARGNLDFDLKQHREETEKSKMLGLVYTHWVTLKEITYDQHNDNINLTYDTYGKTHQLTLSRDRFLAEFHGMVAGTPPKQLTKQATPPALKK